MPARIRIPPHVVKVVHVVLDYGANAALPFTLVRGSVIALDFRLFAAIEATRATGHEDRVMRAPRAAMAAGATGVSGATGAIGNRSYGAAGTMEILVARRTGLLPSFR